MELNLPVLVRVVKLSGRRDPVHQVAPLFMPAVTSQDESLQRALNRLVQQVKKRLDELGVHGQHRSLAEAAMHPDMFSRRVKLRLDLRKRVAQVSYFLVCIRRLERLLVFCPQLPNIWFEVAAGEELEIRAAEVYEKHFLDALRDMDSDDPHERPERYSTTGNCWLTSIEVDVNTNQRATQESLEKFLELWSSEEMDGGIELNRVGRCLDWLYPDELECALGRDAVVDRLEPLISSGDRRPILLVGPSGVGKTAMIHELVRRRVSSRHKRHASRENFWLLAPMRIVSGMSYVGQWENRVQAIFEESLKRQHMLVFDDLPGLFRAGQSAGSDLCVADLLKNELLQGRLRVLAEITDEGFDRLAEMDRGFADLFHVERIEPTDERTTLRIAIATARELEQRHKVSFDHTVLPAATQLQRQYQRQVAFPGKLCRFLKSLAIKFHQQQVNQEMVLSEFCESMGISLEMIDDQVQLNSRTVMESIRAHVVGQQPAVEACARLVSVAKARLNDPGKPLGTLLFLGPTGVGKTECAKALARVLFGSPERLIRFDLNEYKSSHSAARLVGTLGEPEGLLTSAVRHQPFGIVLLDEIEKAHPDVFDILLQVTGEGRLTDALGRTTDFTNSIIIMTSNLGARASLAATGFAAGRPQPGTRGKHDSGLDAAALQQQYLSAAERFFRPEFYNRIDQVVPFQVLTRQQIEMIAEHMMQQVVSREGLVRRRSILQIDAGTIRQVCEQGYQPELGARALKRAVENHFTQPVARQLAQLNSELPTLIRIQPARPTSGLASASTEPGQQPFRVVVSALANAPLQPRIREGTSRREVVECSQMFLERMKTEHLGQRPQGEILAGQLSPELLRYYALDEHAAKVQRLQQAMRDRIETSREVSSAPMLPVGDVRMRSSRRLVRNYQPGLRWLKDLNSIRDIHRYVDEHQKSTQEAADIPNDIAELLGQASLFELVSQPDSFQCDYALELYGDATMRREEISSLFQTIVSGYTGLLESFDFAFRHRSFVRGQQYSICLFRVDGCGARLLLGRESGAQLYADRHGQLNLLRCGLVRLDNPTGFDNWLRDPSNPESLSATSRGDVAEVSQSRGLLADLLPAATSNTLRKDQGSAAGAERQQDMDGTQSESAPVPESSKPDRYEPTFQFLESNLEVLRVFDHNRRVHDWRTGMSLDLRGEPAGWLRSLVLRGMDPPREFLDLYRPDDEDSGDRGEA